MITMFPSQVNLVNPFLHFKYGCLCNELSVLELVVHIEKTISALKIIHTSQDNVFSAKCWTSCQSEMYFSIVCFVLITYI